MPVIIIIIIIIIINNFMLPLQPPYRNPCTVVCDSHMIAAVSGHFFLRNVSFPVFAGISAFMKIKFLHFYLFSAHFRGF